MGNKSKSFKREKWMAVIATASIIFISIVNVMVVRAYLTAQSDEMQNEFAPMTYTDTEIYESTSKNLTMDTSYIVEKSAVVKNPAGGQKKPVFVRVAVVCAVYDPSGINIAYQYNCTASFTLNTADWTKGSDGYYYYNKIVDPGEETSELFDGKSVKINNAESLPEDCTVHVNVIADTVQAVSTDSSKWTKDDYTVVEVSKAWEIEPSFDKDTKIIKWS